MVAVGSAKYPRALFTNDGVEVAFYTLSDARLLARSNIGETALSTLTREARANVGVSEFDIFLSHAFRDAELILGVKRILEQGGRRRVYVDWIDDAQLDRERVTVATANTIRMRMRSSRSLIFATSSNSVDSKWMPWELGYFDGLRADKIAVMPLVASEGATFAGQEYLSLYPYIERLAHHSDPFVMDRRHRRMARVGAFAARAPTNFTNY